MIRASTLVDTGDGYLNHFVSFRTIKLNAEVLAGAIYSAIQAKRLEAEVSSGRGSEAGRVVQRREDHLHLGTVVQELSASLIGKALQRPHTP